MRTDDLAVATRDAIVLAPNEMTIQRRDLLFAGAGLAMAKVLATTTACAGQGQSGGSATAPAEPAATPATTANGAFASAAANCVVVGEDCMRHCLVLLGGGDTSMAGCSTSVYDMLAVCQAVQRLATTDSPQLPAMASVCAAACERCESECAKHEHHHAECKACAQACRATIALAKQFA